jgi:hypothetical protein
MLSARDLELRQQEKYVPQTKTAAQPQRLEPQPAETPAAALERAMRQWWETLTDEQRAAALDGRPGTLAHARPVTRKIGQKTSHN